MLDRSFLFAKILRLDTAKRNPGLRLKCQGLIMILATGFDLKEGAEIGQKPS